MAQLYRKAALERISSPEQLDKALVISSPLSWLALAAITLMIAAAVIWSVLGTIPVTVTVQGMIVPAVSTNAVYADSPGTVTALLVRPGDAITPGKPVLQYEKADGTAAELVSDQTGVVSNVLAEPGAALMPGGDVLRLSPMTEAGQAAVCYVPLAQAQKLSEGMRVYVYLNAADSQSSGHMEARVINMDSHAASVTGMGYVVGTDNNVAAAFMQDGPVVALTCELLADSSSQNGYRWSNDPGKRLAVTNGSLITARVITEEVAPITKLFSRLGELWGN